MFIGVETKKISEPEPKISFINPDTTNTEQSRNCTPVLPNGLEMCKRSHGAVLS